jgi:hypothetical protein
VFSPLAETPDAQGNGCEKILPCPLGLDRLVKTRRQRGKSRKATGRARQVPGGQGAVKVERSPKGEQYLDGDSADSGATCPAHSCAALRSELRARPLDASIFRNVTRGGVMRGAIEWTISGYLIGSAPGNCFRGRLGRSPLARGAVGFAKS